MFKQKMVLEVKGAEDRMHRLECDPSTPLGEVHDAVCAMKNFVVQKINEQNEQAEKEKCCNEGKCEESECQKEQNS